jgi:hypothetical protein
METQGQFTTAGQHGFACTGNLPVVVDKYFAAIARYRGGATCPRRYFPAGTFATKVVVLPAIALAMVSVYRVCEYGEYRNMP